MRLDGLKRMSTVLQVESAAAEVKAREAELRRREDELRVAQADLHTRSQLLQARCDAIAQALTHRRSQSTLHFPLQLHNMYCVCRLA